VFCRPKGVPFSAQDLGRQLSFVAEGDLHRLRASKRTKLPQQMFGHRKGSEIGLQTGSRATFYWVEIYSQKFTSILRQGWGVTG